MNLMVTVEENGYDMDVEIINETGHKLPSGYPEGRRMWINVLAFDINDNLVYESGAYDYNTAILNTSGAKIYEAKLGMSQEIVDVANAYGTGTYMAGESFHFALNNVVIKDNRIPPRGFTNANFEAIQASPVGYTYADGSYSDTTSYDLPEDTYRIDVKLLYQTASKEYIEFLRDKNVTDTKGQELYDLWVTYGKSTPEVMQEETFFTSTLGLSKSEVLNQSFALYPNPAKDLVHLQFNFKVSKNVNVDLFTINGVKIGSIYHGNLQPGKQVLDFETSNLASGTYIIKAQIDNKKLSQLLIIK